MNIFKAIEVDKPKKPLRVGVIGEYYTIMVPFSNHFIEKELADARESIDLGSALGALLDVLFDEACLLRRKVSVEVLDQLISDEFAVHYLRSSNLTLSFLIAWK